MTLFSRVNDSIEAQISVDKIHASGSFKDVWAGTYTEGARQGEPCVAKEFQTGSVYEDRYFAAELKVIQKAQEIVDEWNRAAIINRTIVLNNPEVWTYLENGKKVLIEPFILDFRKFNSNSGWAPDTDEVWADAMQALSHFSYHVTQWTFLLCDLQGAKHDNGYVLSDPAITSRYRSRFGPSDLGQAGIRDFFRRHKCGLFCKSTWLKAICSGSFTYASKEGTTMVPANTFPRRNSRAPHRRQPVGAIKEAPIDVAVGFSTVNF